MIKHSYLTDRWDEQILPLRVRVDQEIIAVKWYSTFSKALGLKPSHQIGKTSPPWHQTVCREAVCVFYSSSRLTGTNENANVTKLLFNRYCNWLLYSYLFSPLLIFSLISVSYNPSPSLYPRPRARESRYCMYSMFHSYSWVLFFHLHPYYSSKEMSSSTKYNFMYLI